MLSLERNERLIEMMHQHVYLFDKEYRHLFGAEEPRPPNVDR